MALIVKIDSEVKSNFDLPGIDCEGRL